MKTAEELRSALRAIDHRSYPAYKSLAGSWSFGTYTLNIEHVQGDPFAAPSQLSVCQRRCDFVVFRRTGNAKKWRVKVYSP